MSLLRRVGAFTEYVFSMDRTAKRAKGRSRPKPCHNFDNYKPIFIIFGRNVTEKVSSEFGSYLD